MTVSPVCLIFILGTYSKGHVLEILDYRIVASRVARLDTGDSMVWSRIVFKSWIVAVNCRDSVPIKDCCSAIN